MSLNQTDRRLTVNRSSISLYRSAPPANTLLECQCWFTHIFPDVLSIHSSTFPTIFSSSTQDIPICCFLALHTAEDGQDRVRFSRRATAMERKERDRECFPSWSVEVFSLFPYKAWGDDETLSGVVVMSWLWLRPSGRTDDHESFASELSLCRFKASVFTPIPKNQRHCCYYFVLMFLFVFWNVNNVP